MRTLALHNSVYALLANRCGHEDSRTYAGQSLIVDPQGTVIAHAGDTPQLVLADYDLNERSETARQRGFLTSRTARRTLIR